MNELIDNIRNSVIGARQPLRTPFGEKPLVYAEIGGDFVFDKLILIFLLKSSFIISLFLISF